MATVQEVLKDPKFLALPPTERQKVLDKIDPKFAALPPEEKQKVVSATSGGKPPSGAGLARHQR